MNQLSLKHASWHYNDWYTMSILDTKVIQHVKQLKYVESFERANIVLNQWRKLSGRPSSGEFTRNK